MCAHGIKGEGGLPSLTELGVQDSRHQRACLGEAAAGFWTLRCLLGLLPARTM